MTNAEIDRRVAVEVMGWRLHEYDQPTYGGKVRTARWIDAASPPESEWVFVNAGNIANTYPLTRASDAWQPSTDIQDAMQVVEKIGGPMRLDYNHINKSWTVQIRTMKAIGHASLPTAISFAALAWAESKKGTQ